MNAIILILAVSFSGYTFGNDGTVSFTLHNSSSESVFLKIPGLMNPNLSPMSNSGVTLETGQAIYFKYNKKKYLLLEVGSKLNDTTVDVPNLIKERIEALGLKDGRKCCLFGRR